MKKFILPLYVIIVWIYYMMKSYALSTAQITGADYRALALAHELQRIQVFGVIGFIIILIILAIFK